MDIKAMAQMSIADALRQHNDSDQEEVEDIDLIQPQS